MPKLGTFGTGSLRASGFQGYLPVASTNQATFTNPGTFTWTPPDINVRTVSVLVVGGGGGGGGRGRNGTGGGGGALTYVNNMSVSYGTTYTLNVAGGGGVGYTGSASWFGPSGSTATNSYLYANGGGAGTSSVTAVNESTWNIGTAGATQGPASTTGSSGIGQYYSFNWVCPDGVFSITAVCVGGGGGGAGWSSTGNSGGGGGQGGCLSWVKSTNVVPGATYLVHVGTKGINSTTIGVAGQAGGDSAFFDVVGVTVVSTDNTNGILLDFTNSLHTINDLKIGNFLILSSAIGNLTAGKRYIIVNKPTGNYVQVTDGYQATVATVNPLSATATGTITVQIARIVAAGGAPGLLNGVAQTARTSFLPGLDSGGASGGGYGGAGGNRGLSTGINYGGGGGGAAGYGTTSSNGNGGGGGQATDEANGAGGTVGLYGSASGGSSGIGVWNSSQTAIMACIGGSAGGGVGITTIGVLASGAATTQPIRTTTTTAASGYSGKGGSGGNPSSSNLVQSNGTSNSTGASYGAGAYGAGSGGCSYPMNATGYSYGGAGGDGVVRIVWGTGKYYNVYSPGPAGISSITVVSNSSDAYAGGGGGGAGGYSGPGGKGGGVVGATTTGGSGGTGNKGSAFGGSVTSYAGGAGGGISIVGDQSFNEAPALSAGNGGAGGGAGRGPYGGGGVSYLGPTDVNNVGTTTAVSGSAASTTNASSAANGNSGGSDGAGGVTSALGTAGINKKGGGYGGGGGGGSFGGIGNGGFVRIIWGNGRRYPSTYVNDLVQAGSLVIGNYYTIAVPGNTKWTNIGAANNTSGTRFQATGIGTGFGSAYLS